MICAKCKTENPEGLKFCNECGAAFKLSCPSCRFENAPTAKFCGNCGSLIAAAVALNQPDTSAIRLAAVDTEALEGERKTITALFADIKGSMELMEGLDPEAARAIVDPALKLMIDAVHRYGGYIVQSTGDGIFALFGAPVAYEDHPQRALYASLRMQDEMRQYSTKLRQAGHQPIEARVGVNTGEVVVSSLATSDRHAEYTPIGHATSLAARMQALAPTGSIAVTSTTRKLCEGYFTFNPLGPTVVKGVTEMVEVFETTGLGPLRTRLQRAAARGLTKFVGRQREIDALKHAADQAQAGHDQIVAVIADPGVGKSRLFYEFRATSQSGWRMLEAFSVSHGKASAYLPVIELLRNYFEISTGDDQRKRREKVAGKIAVLDRSLEDTVLYLYSLLGMVEGGDLLAQMDGQLKKRRTLEAIKRILLRESLNQPLIVMFEDLHWIDEQTQELLNLLADSIGTAKILLLVNYRPEYRHEWGQKTYYTQVRLDPLGNEGAEEMLKVLLGEDGALAPVRRLILERTGGNPFFIEEMVQALFEQGVLARNGSIKLAKSLSEIRIPATVHGVLASRIDRLPSPQKELLQTVSIIGREFPVSLVRHVVATSDDELQSMLAELQLAEFIYEQPAVGEVEYIFKHALTQEVAYSSVLLERRRVTHERVGQAIEAIYETRIEEHLSELAYHYRRSNNTHKAIDYLKCAAEQAADRSAIVEAEGQLRDALGLLTTEPATPERDLREFELQTTLGVVLLSTSFGAPEREQPLQRAYELCERIGNEQGALAVLYQLGQFYIQQGRFGEARSVVERAAALADHAKDQILRVGAEENLAECYFWTGELPAAKAYFERALASCEDISRQELIRSYGFDLSILPPLFLGFLELLLGWPERAIQWERRAIERALSSAHPFSQALGLGIVSLQQCIRADFDAASECFIPVRRICDQYGFLEGSGWALHAEAWNHFWRGEQTLGLAEMNESIRVLRSVGSFNVMALRYALLAEMQFESGDIHAVDTLVKALEVLEWTNQGWCEPEVYRIAAKITLRKPDSDPTAAEVYLCKAVELAKGQSAKWWELRTTVSLARLLRETGRGDEGRKLLAEIYNWFTEGFDTADLKDAKALLDELSA